MMRSAARRAELRFLLLLDEEGNITPYTYLNYAEGIYVGYKYYETRYEDAVMKSGNAGDYDYRENCTVSVWLRSVPDYL